MRHSSLDNQAKPSRQACLSGRRRRLLRGGSLKTNIVRSTKTVGRACTALEYMFSLCSNSICDIRRSICSRFARTRYATFVARYVLALLERDRYKSPFRLLSRLRSKHIERSISNCVSNISKIPIGIYIDENLTTVKFSLPHPKRPK